MSHFSRCKEFFENILQDIHELNTKVHNFAAFNAISTTRPFESVNESSQSSFVFWFFFLILFLIFYLDLMVLSKEWYANIDFCKSLDFKEYILDIT